MASILDRYGIKEVADVTFYKINEDGTQGTPVLYLDTLKVSTIEQTAETTDARGGKGNPKLITWDYGKDITVTLEDALFSAKSLSVMFGNGSPVEGIEYITRTVMARVGKDNTIQYVIGDVLNAQGSAERKKIYFGTAKPDGISFSEVNPAIVDPFATDEKGGKLDINTSTGAVTPAATIDEDKGEFAGEVEEGDKIFLTYKMAAKTKTISVSADTFPGNYYVTGDTYARSDVDGSDQFFQFIIPKAKVTSENTITLEAEGDPSVFNMNLTVLRPEDGEMMRLVQYDLTTEEVSDED